MSFIGQRKQPGWFFGGRVPVACKAFGGVGFACVQRKNLPLISVCVCVIVAAPGFSPGP